MNIKNKIEEILLTEYQYIDYNTVEKLLDLFAVSGSLPSVDPLDDENSEIHKIGREISEMSDEEFEANCKAIEKMLKGSKGNDR